MKCSLSTLDRCSCSDHDWFIRNGFSLNPAQSDIWFMGTRQQLDKINCPEFPILIRVIVPGDEIKSLGVRLDMNLTFNKNVDEICKYHSRALRNIRGNLNTDRAKEIACAIGFSRLDLPRNSTGHICGNIKKLQRAQNTPARLVVGSRRKEHITPVLKKLHWLPVRKRITFKIATLTHKVRTTQQSAYLASLINIHEPERVLRSSNKGYLAVPRTRTALVSRSFWVCAPVIWNTLPRDIRELISISGFKRPVKNHLLCSQSLKHSIERLNSCFRTRKVRSFNPRQIDRQICFNRHQEQVCVTYTTYDKKWSQ